MPVHNPPDTSKFATTALDNLANVAINTSLISDTDSTDDLGSSSIRFSNLYVDGFTGNTITLDGATGVNVLDLTDNVADALSITSGGEDRAIFDTTNDKEQFRIIGNGVAAIPDFYIESSTGTYFWAGDSNLLVGVFISSPLSGTNKPVTLTIQGVNEFSLPQLNLTFDDDNLFFKFQDDSWEFQTADVPIRLVPGNDIIQLEGKMQIGGQGFNQVGGTQGFIEWSHDGTDGFIVSSLGKIFIPQLVLPGPSLGTFGDSITEIDIRRTVSSLDNSNVTGSGTVQFGGDFSNATNLTYRAEITTGGEVGAAKYRWSDTDGSVWNVENITTGFAPRTMNNGLKVWFVAGVSTDFNANDYANVVAVGTDNQNKTLQVDTRNNQSNFGGDVRLLSEKKIVFDAP